MLNKPTTLSTFRLFVFLGIALAIIFIASICLGSVLLPLKQVSLVLAGSSQVDEVVRQIVFDFRIPRVITASLAGASLATAGLLMQTVFRNPLADPFVLGVNAGASFGVAIVLLVLAPSGVLFLQDLELSGQALIVIAASAGAGVVLAIILLFAQRLDVMALLILGLMLTYVIGAIVSILMFYSMADRLQSFFSWSYGEFGNVSWSQLQAFAPIITCGLIVSLGFAKQLDALLLGDQYAESMGTRVKLMRFWILGLASLLAGTITGFCGPIGFLGIAAPHLCRYLFRTANHRVLIPASILVGAILAIFADLVAKAPGLDSTLPLNAITALIGAPVIIAALLKQRNLKKIFG